MEHLTSTVVAFDIPNQIANEINYHEFQLSDDPNIIYWIHCDLLDPASLENLKKQIPISDSLLDVLNSKDKTPKFIDNGDDVILRIRGLLSWDPQLKIPPRMGTLTLYLTDRYCITFAKEAILTLRAFRNSYHKGLKYAKTPGFILFLLLDNFINNHSELLYSFEVGAEKLNAHLLASHHNPYNEVMHAKKILMRIKRNVASVRDMLMRMSGRKIPVISEACRLALNELFLHSQMVFSEADEIRDTLNSTLDQLDNNLMQDMGHSMKILSAFAAIFLPLTLIAGIYGMNFHYMPELSWRYGYPFALSLMFGCFFACILYFKRKKWL